MAKTVVGGGVFDFEDLRFLNGVVAEGDIT